MSYSFSTTAGASQSTSKPKLEGNKIHVVELESCEAVTIQGVKEPDKVFNVLKFRFSNDDGYFEKTIWEPRPEDFDKRESDYKNPKTGKVEKIPQPSNVDTMMLFFKHVLDVANKKVAQEIDAEQKSLGAKDWNGLRALIVELFKNSKGIKSKLKLLKNKDGEAIIPYFSGMTREGKPYVKNNFFGDKVAFSTYEIDKIKKEANAVVTPMPDENIVEDETSDSNLNLDFEIPNL